MGAQPRSPSRVDSLIVIYFLTFGSTFTSISAAPTEIEESDKEDRSRRNIYLEIADPDSSILFRPSPYMFRGGSNNFPYHHPYPHFQPGGRYRLNNPMIDPDLPLEAQLEYLGNTKYSSYGGGGSSGLFQESSWGDNKEKAWDDEHDTVDSSSTGKSSLFGAVKGSWPTATTTSAPIDVGGNINDQKHDDDPVEQLMEKAIVDASFDALINPEVKENDDVLSKMVGSAVADSMFSGEIESNGDHSSNASATPTPKTENDGDDLVQQVVDESVADLAEEQVGKFFTEVVEESKNVAKTSTQAEKSKSEDKPKAIEKPQESTSKPKDTSEKTIKPENITPKTIPSTTSNKSLGSKNKKSLKSEFPSPKIVKKKPSSTDFPPPVIDRTKPVNMKHGGKKGQQDEDNIQATKSGRRIHGSNKEITKYKPGEVVAVPPGYDSHNPTGPDYEYHDDVGVSGPLIRSKIKHSGRSVSKYKKGEVVAFPPGYATHNPTGPDYDYHDDVGVSGPLISVSSKIKHSGRSLSKYKKGEVVAVPPGYKNHNPTGPDYEYHDDIGISGPLISASSTSKHSGRSLSKYKKGEVVAVPPGYKTHNPTGPDYEYHDDVGVSGPLISASSTSKHSGRSLNKYKKGEVVAVPPGYKTHNPTGPDYEYHDDVGVSGPLISASSTSKHSGRSLNKYKKGEVVAVPPGYKTHNPTGPDYEYHDDVGISGPLITSPSKAGRTVSKKKNPTYGVSKYKVGEVESVPLGYPNHIPIGPEYDYHDEIGSSGPLIHPPVISEEAGVSKSGRYFSKASSVLRLDSPSSGEDLSPAPTPIRRPVHDMEYGYNPHSTHPDFDYQDSSAMYGKDKLAGKSRPSYRATFADSEEYYDSSASYEEYYYDSDSGSWSSSEEYPYQEYSYESEERYPKRKFDYEKKSKWGYASGSGRSGSGRRNDYA